MTHVMPTSQSDTKVLTMAQEPSSGSCVKRSNLEAIRLADADAEKALKRAKVLEERRAAKRASLQHRWMNWRSLRRTQRYQLKRC